MFEDRHDAGRRLADRLAAREVAADVVLAIPRGGLPIGRAVADRLGVPLDVVAARKIGAPGNPELAIGAVASDGTRWLNESVIDRLGVGDEYVEEQAEREGENAREKVERYRGDRPPLDLTGKTVLVVDDGIATGATATACVRLVRAAGADREILAAPVAPADALDDLRDDADEVIVVETPARFRAVGEHYRAFQQVSDEAAREYLDDAE